MDRAKRREPGLIRRNSNRSAATEPNVTETPEGLESARSPAAPRAPSFGIGRSVRGRRGPPPAPNVQRPEQEAE